MATTRTGQTTAGVRPMTADELFKLPKDEARGELIQGVFYPAMPTGGRHGEIEARLGEATLATSFEPSGRLGTVMTGDPGIVLERGPDTVRAPDVAYFSAERLPPDADIAGFLDVVPDLIVEVVSPDDRVTEVREKAEMWTAFGARLVWVVWPETMAVDVYRPEESVVTLGAEDTLTGEDVLPEFSCPVREVFG